jgi:hypothetical protein
MKGLAVPTASAEMLSSKLHNCTSSQKPLPGLAEFLLHKKMSLKLQIDYQISLNLP